MKIYFTVYKITNTINNKIYVGAHKTINLEDDYMGSGDNIKRALKKYGIKNFKKEYIDIFDNENEMFNMESKIVNEDFVKGNNTYNIALGGGGGWELVNQNKSIEERRKNGSWKNYEKRLKILESIPMETRKKIGKKMGDKYGGRNKLTKKEIDNRLDTISNIDLTKFGWVKKVSDILNISHAQVKRFIDKHYIGNIYRRGKNGLVAESVFETVNRNGAEVVGSSPT